MQSHPEHSESSHSPELVPKHSEPVRIPSYDPQVYIDTFQDYPLATRTELRRGGVADAIRHIRRSLVDLNSGDSREDLSDSEVVDADQSPRRAAFERYWDGTGQRSPKTPTELSPSHPALSENEATSVSVAQEGSTSRVEEVSDQDTSLAPPNLPPQDPVPWATEEENEYAEHFIRTGRELAGDVFQEFLTSQEPFSDTPRTTTPATRSMAMVSQTGGRQVWTEDMGDGSALSPAKASTGSFNSADYAHFPLYTYEMVTEEDLHNPGWLPPKNCCLDDRLVFVVTLLEDERTRHERHPADFSTDGEVRASRSPHGLPPKVVDKDGKVWYPVWKRQVVLRGDERAPADNKVRGDTATNLRKKAKGDPAPWSFGTESSTQVERDGVELICWMHVDGLDRQHWERPDRMNYVFWERMGQDKMWPFALPEYDAARPPPAAQASSSTRDLRPMPAKATDESNTTTRKLRRKSGVDPLSTTLDRPSSPAQRGRTRLPSSLSTSRRAVTGTTTASPTRKRLSDHVDQSAAKRQQISSPDDKSSPTVGRTSGNLPVATGAPGSKPATIEQAAGKIALLPVRKGLGDQMIANARVQSLRELRGRSQARIERLRDELRREEEEHLFIDRLIQEAKTERQPLHKMAVISQQSAEVLKPFDDALASSVLKKVDTEIDAGQGLLPQRDPTPGVFRVIGHSEEVEQVSEADIVEETAPADPYGDL